ncbi:MAG: hypothetical protein HY736_17100 [Verrucomicrobia bacterium]|nr:hypothetical protein [Verrucomicrobiota bacterium]
MSPANHLVLAGGATRFCLAEDGRHYLVYSTSGALQLRVTRRGLKGHWFNPRDPNATLGIPFPVAAGRGDVSLKEVQTFTPPADSSEDWVLWISDGSNLNEGSNFPSPGAAISRVVVERLGPTAR